MIETFNNLTECPFANALYQLESESNMITFLYSVVPLLVIKAVIYQSLHIAGLDFVFVFAHIKELLVFLYLCFFEIREILISNVICLCL